MLARWIRANSLRADAPFVIVNCPALSGDLMTSALFGHRKGAFTGAVADVGGKVQEAEGGTLVLDEVGELTADAQARLLRFLNDRTYERLGEARERQADVRLIARHESRARRGSSRRTVSRGSVLSTERRDPHPAGAPRASGGHSLAGASLSVHLRPQAAPHGAHVFSGGRAGDGGARWPGNLRELRNAVERAVILAHRDVLDLSDLGLVPESASDTEGGTPAARVGALVSLDVLEREHIARVVAQSPSLEAAARVLDIDATTLQRKRKRYGLA